MTRNRSNKIETYITFVQNWRYKFILTSSGFLLRLDIHGCIFIEFLEINFTFKNKDHIRTIFIKIYRTKSGKTPNSHKWKDNVPKKRLVLRIQF